MHSIKYGVLFLFSFTKLMVLSNLILTFFQFNLFIIDAKITLKYSFMTLGLLKQKLQHRAIIVFPGHTEKSLLKLAGL